MIESSALLARTNSSLKHVVNVGVNQSLREIAARYEQTPNPKEVLDYHKGPHTRGVIRRTRMILRTIQAFAPEAVSAPDVELGVLGAGFHDISQVWKERVTEQGFIKRFHFSPESEERSAARAMLFMDSANDIVGPIFSSGDKEVVQTGIVATVPAVDERLGTIIQPNFTPGSPLPAQAMALADLGAVGMEGPSALLSDTDTLWLEDNMDFAVDVRNPAAISAQSQARYKDRLFDWMEKQVRFAKGRAQLLETETSGIPQAARAAVRGLFNQFDPAIEALRAEINLRREYDFNLLCQRVLQVAHA